MNVVEYKDGKSPPEIVKDTLEKEMTEEFRMKAAEYCGGRTFKKKQTRFDKMRTKEELGFKPEMNPVVTNFRKADTILKKFDALWRIKAE